MKFSKSYLIAFKILVNFGKLTLIGHFTILTSTGIVFVA